MNIPDSYYMTDTIHRSIGPATPENILSCGFMHKPGASYTQTNLVFPYYGAFLLLDGYGEYTDASGRRYELKPGSFVQRLPGCPHTTIVDGDGRWLEFFLCFSKRTYETLLALQLLSDTPVLQCPPSALAFQKCVHLLDNFKRLPAASTPYLYTLTQNLAMEWTALSKTTLPNMTNKQMLHACELLSKQGTDTVSSRKIAHILSIPYESFRKKFKHIYGSSPTAFQLDQRVNHAKRLLLDTDKSLNEIALLCGFSDAFSFSKAFKKRSGISPLHFRQDLLGL